jgi:pyrimidine-nucleoside phosphorylase
MRAVDIIERKRDGLELSSGEIDFLVDGYVAGDIPDYQVSAFTMAVLWRGMTDAETEAMTRAMIRSGDTVDLSRITRPTVDKHSTGGVGDKTTLVVGPLAAALGAAVPKLSGRGLGHTGGTLDKLESIPGFRIDLSLDELVDITNRTGLAVASPNADIVPADKRFYALRDATATVPSVPLIASSIMSKKLAVETAAIVLDVKVGKGAFFADLAAAREFARIAISLGRGFGRTVRCVLTAMDRPLGFAVGNALEVLEAVRTLRGEGPGDFVEVCTAVTAQMLGAAGIIADETEARRRVAEVLAGGTGVSVMRRWVEAQGGDSGFIDRGFPEAGRRIEVTATADGWVSSVHALEIGRLAMQLGAGRETKEDVIDHSAGIVFTRTVGDEVRRGEPLAVLHTNRDGDEQAWVDALRRAVVLDREPVDPGSPILEVMSAEAATSAG